MEGGGACPVDGGGMRFLDGRGVFPLDGGGTCFLDGGGACLAGGGACLAGGGACLAWGGGRPLDGGLSATLHGVTVHLNPFRRHLAAHPDRLAAAPTAASPPPGLAAPQQRGLAALERRSLRVAGKVACGRAGLNEGYVAPPPQTPMTCSPPKSHLQSWGQLMQFSPPNASHVPSPHTARGQQSTGHVLMPSPLPPAQGVKQRGSSRVQRIGV